MSDPLPSVYIETSIISYLCARDSRDAIVMARQHATRLWWAQRNLFRCFVSDVVIDECSAGDPAAAKKRIDALQGLPVLKIDEQTRRLARLLMAKNIFPAKAHQDALHIAAATMHDMNFLLTWNYKHPANVDVKMTLRLLLNQLQLRSPIVCTPPRLLGE